MTNHEKTELKKKSQNISDWYNDIVVRAELADYGPAKGTMVIRPYAYAIWETLQEFFNVRIKSAGVTNAYFPSLIPYSLIQKEKEHISGFSPQLAVVTIGGGEELKEPLVVRPTSETIMYSMYAKWVQSWRDLPILINQWNNIVRWEKRTYLFLRTSEFLWQEGHTAHETEDEANKMVASALEWYRQIYEDLLAIPVTLGKKSQAETFAGAVDTYSAEVLMSDGKALQGGTSHLLGQNFAKVFGIKFQNREEKSEYVWQTSWGLSTRSLGALFMVHGDDDGLVLPPNVAPYQVVIVPIEKSDSGVDSEVQSYAKEVKNSLMKMSTKVIIDKNSDQSLGRRLNYWELKGVPLRIEIGKKELTDGTFTVFRRDTKEKTNYKLEELGVVIAKLLTDIQSNLFNKAKQFLEENTHEVDTYENFKKLMADKRGFIKAFWCEDPACEEKIKEETKAATRCLPLGSPEEKGKCIYCGKESKHRWLFAQSY